MNYDQAARTPADKPDRKPDTVAARLQQINAILGECESRVDHIKSCLDGASQETDNRLANEPSSISGYIMEINGRAQRLAQELQALMQGLAG